MISGRNHPFIEIYKVVNGEMRSVLNFMGGSYRLRLDRVQLPIDRAASISCINGHCFSMADGIAGRELFLCIARICGASEFHGALEAIRSRSSSIGEEAG